MEVGVALAEARAVREVRPNHWHALGRYRQLLREREQGAARVRGGLNNRIRVLQRRAYGFRDEEYLRLKILTCQLPKM